uniref:(California timema) hypothetical protein n=1 Tax=Timema californicum TaxID=61474 RepID=A0A7R9P9K6_TIMCA|nr:unnamed protein product [Timema californicum]
MCRKAGTVNDIVNAACVLHNHLLEREGIGYRTPDTGEENEMVGIAISMRRQLVIYDGSSAATLRNIFFIVKINSRNSKLRCSKIPSHNVKFLKCSLEEGSDTTPPVDGTPIDPPFGKLTWAPSSAQNLGSAATRSTATFGNGGVGGGLHLRLGVDRGGPTYKTAARKPRQISINELSASEGSGHAVFHSEPSPRPHWDVNQELRLSLSLDMLRRSKRDPRVL